MLNNTNTYAALVSTSFFVFQCVHNERVASLERHATFRACVLSLHAGLCRGQILLDSSLWLRRLRPSPVCAELSCRHALHCAGLWICPRFRHRLAFALSLHWLLWWSSPLTWPQAHLKTHSCSINNFLILTKHVTEQKSFLYNASLKCNDVP